MIQGTSLYDSFFNVLTEKIITSEKEDQAYQKARIKAKKASKKYWEYSTGGGTAPFPHQLRMAVSQIFNLQIFCEELIL